MKETGRKPIYKKSQCYYVERRRVNSDPVKEQKGGFAERKDLSVLKRNEMKLLKEHF